MIESRCGLLCSECKYREIMKCAGCLAIQKPFWGKTCPIKTCCEGKKVDNCGQCDRFACKQLHEFAYDPATDDEGERIQQCEDWAHEASQATPAAPAAGAQPADDAPAAKPADTPTDKPTDAPADAKPADAPPAE